MAHHFISGTQVMANFWAVHHDKGCWEQPDEFLPERFLNEDGTLRSLLDFPNFMPFSTGQRSCIGKGMAKAELFLLLGRLLREFTFELPVDAEVDLEGEAAVSLIPKPYDVIATPRYPTIWISSGTGRFSDDANWTFTSSVWETNLNFTQRC